MAVLGLLEDQILAPSELAEQLGVSLPLVSFHVKQLEKWDLIELVRTEQRRGCIAHYYRARPRSQTTGLAWDKMPIITKREISIAFAQPDPAVRARPGAAGNTARETEPAHRATVVLDERGSEQLSAMLTETLERVAQIHAESAGRLSETHGVETRRATVVLALFEGPNAPRGGLPPSRVAVRKTN